MKTWTIFDKLSLFAVGAILTLAAGPCFAVSADHVIAFFSDSEQGLISQYHKKIVQKSKTVSEQLNFVQENSSTYSNNGEFDALRESLNDYEEKRTSLVLKIQLLSSMHRLVISQYSPGQDLSQSFRRFLKRIIKTEMGLGQPNTEGSRKNFRDYALTLFVLLGVRNDPGLKTLDFIRSYFNTYSILKPKRPEEIMKNIDFESGDYIETGHSVTKEEAGDYVDRLLQKEAEEKTEEETEEETAEGVEAPVEEEPAPVQDPDWLPEVSGEEVISQEKDNLKNPKKKSSQTESVENDKDVEPHEKGKDGNADLFRVSGIRLDHGNIAERKALITEKNLP